MGFLLERKGFREIHFLEKGDLGPGGGEGSEEMYGMVASAAVVVGVGLFIEEMGVFFKKKGGGG